MTEKIYVSWDDFHRQVKILAQKIKESGDFDRIIAVSRGGLIPAGILAYELGIRDCGVVNVSSYDGESRRQDEEIEVSGTQPDADTRTLIVDDLADSGRTLKILRQKYPQAITACVYAKPAGQSACDIFAAAMPDRWVVFPWD